MILRLISQSKKSTESAIPKTAEGKEGENNRINKNGGREGASICACTHTHTHTHTLQMQFFWE
jgi:hypothetical protein